MSKIYVILVEYCMKLTLLSASKGSNYYKHVEKTYNFRIKSETGKSAIKVRILRGRGNAKRPKKMLLLN